eukprot:gene2557-4990_t
MIAITPLGLFVLVQGDYFMKPMVTPDFCYGGEAFFVQPAVAVTSSKGDVALNFIGRAYAYIGTSPYPYEKLWMGLSCDVWDNCGVESSSYIASAEFVDGVAVFQDLLIKSAGVYTLYYVGYDSTNIAFSSTYSASFVVQIGNPYKITFRQNIGNALGGTPFARNPIIALVDRGSNTISTENSASVQAFLSTNPTNGILKPVANTKLTFYRGVVQFIGLYINETGSPYAITFTASLILPGTNIITSRPFTVGIGKAHKLTPVTNMSMAAIEGGEFFKIPPMFHIRDAGGNILHLDCTSMISVQIYSNPSHAQITTSIENIKVKAENEPFDVIIGPPRVLASKVISGNAWAGAQPFKQQPILLLTDYGGNLLTADYSSVTTASIVQSLSVTRVLTIDTKNAPIVTPTRVRLNVTNGNYPAGSNILITVEFTNEVTVTGPGTPVLILNVLSSADDSNRNGTLIGPRLRTLTLTFLYQVRQGDYNPNGVPLDYIGNQVALSPENTEIIDGNNRLANLYLPYASLVQTYAVYIETTLPTIDTFKCLTPDGEYGEGEYIYYHLAYSLPIVVRGQPYIKLTTHNASNSGLAIFNKRINSTIVEFLYIVKNGDSTSLLQPMSYIIQMDSYPVRGAILRDADNPSATAQISIDTNILTSNIVIDTTPPILDVSYGVRTTVPDGIYYPGERIPITIAFTKPISVIGASAILFLQTKPGPVPEAALFSRIIADNNNDDTIIEFIYIVTPMSNITRLDIYNNGSALQFIAEENSIRRKSTVPTTLVRVSTMGLTKSGRSLNSTANIALYGFPPVITSTYAEDDNSQGLTGQTLYPDAFIYIYVTFSIPVTVICAPVLVMTVGIDREANYISGNNTNTLVFKYIIQVGDISANNALYYRYVPNALCSESGCPEFSPHCNIYAASSHPLLPANLEMPWTGGSKKYGVSLGQVHIIPRLVHRNTTIVSINCIQLPGEYGAGFGLNFIVHFTDEVFFASNIITYPKLRLNIHNSISNGINVKYAIYESGIGTKSLLFSYLISAGDNATNVDITYDTNAKSAFICLKTENCNIYNRANQYTDMSMSNTYSIQSYVSVYTLPPQITRIWSEKATSPYDGYYTVGEEFEIYLSFDRPVVISGNAPRLAMELNNGQRYADFEYISSNNTILTFKLIIQYGDATSNLSYIGRNAFVQYNNSCKLYRQAPLPVTEVMYITPGPYRLEVAVGTNTLKVDTSQVPKVLRVTTSSRDYRYTPGDRIIIAVAFSHYIQVTGYAYLQLETGGKITHAPILSNNVTSQMPTKILYFEYIVEAFDFSSALEYVDKFSLRRGITATSDYGRIQLASTNPTINANIDLPDPGSTGSLSHGRNIIIDGSRPYVKNMQILAETGIYGVGFIVKIQMDFSVPIVVRGQPRILLETGLVDRYAKYVSGSGSTTLIFSYEPQPGDSTAKLDYFSIRSELLSSRTAFDLNGGEILALSTNPILPALIHLNPIGGYLTGTADNIALSGVFTYNDLSLPIRGPDYLLRFESAPPTAHRTISTTQDVFVSFSNEFELRAKEALNGHRVGWSVDISGSIAVLGSPYSNQSVNAVQTVTTTSSSIADPVKEIQILSVEVAPQPVIQSFFTTADAYETVGGFFTINYGLLGPSRPIPANALSEQFHAIIEYDMPKLGNVTAVREPYIYCGCEGAYKWTLTFHDLTEGFFASLTLNGAGLTGKNAGIIGPNIIQSSSYIRGSFQLTGHGLKTSDIPYDADADRMAAALLELEYPVDDIQISPTDNSRGRSWTITFGAYKDSYEIPLLGTDKTGLSGGKDITVWTEIARAGLHGPREAGTGGLYGGFALEWRGNTTTYLPYNCSAIDMKYALEALPIIGQVEVERSTPSTSIGYTWTVTFVSILSHSERGYAPDIMGDLEPFIAHNYLIGTNATVVIGSIWNSSMRYNVWGAEREGRYGKNSGAVYVFQRFDDDWQEVKQIKGNDTTEGDQFGTSVSVDGDVLVVGAIGVAYKGLIEQQTITCYADNGTFIIYFRGWKTSPISFNVTREDLIRAMVNPRGTSLNLVSMHRIVIDSWGGGGLCSGKTAVITMESPVDGFPNATTAGYLEPLQIVNNALTYQGQIGIINVTISQKGTRRVHGPGADNKIQGSVYLFKAYHDCPSNQTICKYKIWQQEAQFFPINATGFERYGQSVSLAGDRFAVGAPGTKNGAGAVYVYKFSSNTNSWSFLNLLTATVWSNAENDLFGYCVAFNGATLVIGSPGRDSDSGAVYVFKPSITGRYQAHQEVKPVGTAYPLVGGDYYGSSVAISGNTMVVGACQRDSPAIYLGKETRAASMDTGAVYIFQRDYYSDIFRFWQILEPTNIKYLDRFGWAVDISDNIIIAGAVQDYRGDLNPAKAIMELSTSATYSKIPVSGSFQLKWKQTQTSKSGGVYVSRTSRHIPYDVDATRLQYIIQTDLLTGDVLVSRSTKGLYDNSYIWTITFVGSTANVNVLEVDPTEMTGTNVAVRVNYTNHIPLETRGKSHVFIRTSNTERFVEQVYAAPFNHQPLDRCGFSVAISGLYTVIGCPNRDTYVSNQNHGSGMVYDLNLINIQFSKSKYYVTEGNNFYTYITRRRASISDVPLYMITLDRNADAIRQSYLGYLYGIIDSDLTFPYLVTDATGLVGTAIARSQHSRWIDGVYDYRGLSDYYPINQATAFLTEYTSVNYSISTLSDGILEVPDENATLIIYSPGLWPSVLGNLYATFTIEDDGDGYEPTNATFQYEKIYSVNTPVKSEIGHSIGVNSDVGIIVSGSPLVNVDNFTSAGVAYVYRLLLSHWSQVKSLQSPNPIVNGRFGDDVKINKAFGRNATTIAVTEPGAVTVHVFSWYTGNKFDLEASLHVPEANLLENRYAERNTIGLDGDLLVVGCPGLEAIYLFLRSRNSSDSLYTWQLSKRLRSSDFDYDFLLSYIHFHRQEFGTSVAVSGRTIAVGAPYADYDKLGTEYVELDWDTEGTAIFGTGRGKAYVFYSNAPQQIIYLKTSQVSYTGSFRLLFEYKGLNATTIQLSSNTSADNLKSALEALGNIYEVNVDKSINILGVAGVNYIWTITFISEWTNPPLLTPLWNGNGCNECEILDFPIVNVTQIEVYEDVPLGDWIQYDPILAEDRRQGDRFGSNIALDGDQLVVSAIFSSGVTSTTWDFETGSLEGWSVRGFAFTHQPTFGDNSYVRSVYRGKPAISLLGAGQTANIQGRYYVGTFELRPGNASNYRTPHSEYAAGSVQGDAPTGSITSQVFIIGGNTISFLIGGGCDPSTVYVELLIDGLGAYKTTGKCSERMERQSFNVTSLLNRAAQIRVVDAGVSTWGHINIDDIQFDWDIRGGIVNGTSVRTNKPVYGGKVETVHSGAVYLFRRHENGTKNFCVSKISTCIWTQETKISSSDKRSNDQFGASIAISDESGVLLVGSPQAAYTGFYKEIPSVYPYRNESTGLSDTYGLHFPVDSSYMSLFQELPTRTAQASGAYGIWELRKNNYINPDIRASEKAGAVYVFVREPANVNSGVVTAAPYWYYTESAKLQPGDEFARDHFGYAVAISGDLMVVGSPGQDGFSYDAGALYLYKAGFAALSFEQAEFHILEGQRNFIVVSIIRDSNVYANDITIEYATSDLTAKAINSTHYDYCMQLDPFRRSYSDCGDYKQTNGLLTIPYGKNYGAITVFIVDNLCRDRFMKYLQITLSVPGSAALQGESMSAKIRKDDDDFTRPLCNY